MKVKYELYINLYVSKDAPFNHYRLVSLTAGMPSCTKANRMSKQRLSWQRSLKHARNGLVAVSKWLEMRV